MDKDNLLGHANAWRPGKNLDQENGLSQLGPSEYAHTPVLGHSSMNNTKSSDPMDNLEVGMVLRGKGQWDDRTVVVETIDTGDSFASHTILSNLKIVGWRVRPTPPPLTTLTHQQIADKFGVPVETLRIKE